MQSIRTVVRQLGTPNPQLDIYSADEISEYLQYQYPGYELKDSHYLGEVKDGSGNVQGYKFAYVLVKSDVTEQTVVSAKQGRKAKKDA